MFQRGVLFGVVWWTAFSLVTSFMYVTVGITRATSVIAFSVTTLVCILFARSRFGRIKPTALSKEEQPFGRMPFLILAVAIDLFLLVLFSLVRTDEPLKTPWVFPVSIATFALYGMATCSLVFARTVRFPMMMAGLSLHLFTAFGVALVAFRYGFGYDPIIHQTAERFIMEHGKILPLQPYYIGQYALVTTLSFLTSLSTDLIDRALVPILAAVSLPLIGIVGLVRGYSLSIRTAIGGVLILFTLFPISPLTFTVPHNLSVLYTLWWLFLIPLFGRSLLETTAVIGSSLAALAVHPLLGGPLLVGTLIRALQLKMNHVPPRVIATIGVTLVTTAIIGMFALVRIKAGLAPFEFSHIGQGLQAFVSFFAPPAFSPITQVHLIALYYYEYFIKIIIPVVGFFLLWKRLPAKSVRILILSISGGMLTSILLFLCFMSLPGIVPAEQYEFVLRLRDAFGMILFFAVVVWGCARFSGRAVRTAAYSALALLALGAASAMSLYLTYPQTNDVRRYAGENVSSADLAVVRTIEEHESPAKEYVVLSPSLISALGLREVGFDRTFETPSGSWAHAYPINPNEALFPYAQEALYRGLSRSNREQLYALVSGRTIYFAVPESWWRREEIAGEMQAIGAVNIESAGSHDLYRFPKEIHTQDKSR